MVRAFITVKTEPGRAEAFSETVGDLENVAAVTVVAGDFDVMIEAEAEEVYELINTVATRVRDFEEIQETKTYVCLE